MELRARNFLKEPASTNYYVAAGRPRHQGNGGTPGH